MESNSSSMLLTFITLPFSASSIALMVSAFGVFSS
jgi:hypothetical protein